MKLPGCSNDPLEDNYSLLQNLAFCVGLAVAGVSPHALATDGTWANPAVVTPTLTTTTTSGVYTSSSTLAVGDAVMARATAGGLTTNRIYYVVSVSAGNYTLSLTPGGAALSGVTTSGTTIASNGIVTWDATAATNTQSAASWNTVPSGTDAVATIASDSNSANNAVAIKNAVTIGTLNFSATSQDFNLTSSNDGTTTTLSVLTFDTSSGSPTINVTGGKLLRLGLNDASFTQGTLKINGTKGLVINATSGSVRIENTDWSGFTNGSGGVGTLTLQAGQIQTTVTNALGSGTGALNVVVGTATSPSGTTAPELILGNSQNISVNNLDGTSNGRISGASRTLTIGAGNGTNTDFAGIIGQTAAGANSALSLTKIGTGTQSISGQIVSLLGVVTVNGAGGTLILSGSNSYSGATTVTAGTLRVTNAGALGATTGVGIGGSGILDLRNDSSVAFTGTGGSNVAVNPSANGATINVDRATGAGAAVNLTIGTLTLNTAVTNQTNFTGSTDASLVTGAVTTGNSASGTETINNNITGGGSLTFASISSLRTGSPTLSFSGSGNTIVSGAITQTGTTALTYAGSGMLTLNGSNSYTGATNINSGTVKLGNISALGTSQIATIGAGATLDVNGQAITNTFADKAIGLSTGAGTITNTGAAADLTGMGTIGATATRLMILDGTGNMTFGQQFTGSYSVTKNGNNTVILSGSSANNLAVTAVNAGTLELAKTGVNAVNGTSLTVAGGTVKLGSGGSGGDQINNTTNVTINSGTFNMNGLNETAGTLTIGDGTNNATVSGGSSSTYTASSGKTFEAKSGSVDVILAGSGIALNKTTGGTVTLSQANTYTGATSVTAGTLLVSGSISGSASTVSNAGSTLGGTGTVGAVTVNSGAILQGGDGASASGGLTSAGNVSLTDGSVIKLTLGASNTHSSLFRTGGTWSFANNQAFSFVGAQAGTFDNIISGLAGTETNLITGGSTAWNFSDVNWNYSFTYDGTGGVDLAIVAVPEPNAVVSLLGGVCVLLGLQRFRRRMRAEAQAFIAPGGFPGRSGRRFR